MSIKVIVENTDINRSIEVFHNPGDQWSASITPGARVGCYIKDSQELVLRRASLTPDMIPEPAQPDDDYPAPVVLGEE